MERTAKKRVRKGITRSNGDGNKCQNKAKIARSSSPNIAMSPEATVEVEPTENVVQLLNEIVPDEESLTIKLECDPEFPVTDDCLNLSQLHNVRTRGGAKPRSGRVRTRGGSGMAPVAAPSSVPAGVGNGSGGGGTEVNVHSRGRGVRSRGGGHRANARASTLHVKARFEVVEITEYPQGSPLEVPLHPLKKRRLRSPCRQTPAPSSSSSHNLNENVPSPVTFVEVPAPTTNRNPGRRPLQDREIEDILNFGSDLDSDDDEDEIVLVPTGIPRATAIYFETPIDANPSKPFSASVGVETTEREEPTEESTTANSPSAWMSDPMYTFQWQSYPNPAVPPQTRREPFTVTNVGPTVAETTPVNLFKCIWDDDIMGMIVTETNRYAEQLAARMLDNNSLCPSSRICFWKDTNTEELYVYFGIILAMGVVIKSRITEYWSTSNDIFCTPGFSANMSLRRFQLLSTCLHFRDNAHLPENALVENARIFKIEPIIHHLNHKFQTMYVMGQNIALDESLLQWRGWLQISQLIPNKAATVGIKTYEVCESQTGYLWRFIVHSHGPGTRTQSSTQDPLCSFTPSLVLKLLEGLQHKGYTVWMDNYYNSPILARKLKRMGFDCVGTLRTNRQFVPQEINSLQKNHMRPGQVTGVTSGDVDLMVWRDQNRVATISTYHGNAVTTDSNGNIKPALIRDYNIMMGGVDKKINSSHHIQLKENVAGYGTRNFLDGF